MKDPDLSDLDLQSPALKTAGKAYRSLQYVGVEKVNRFMSQKLQFIHYLYLALSIVIPDPATTVMSTRINTSQGLTWCSLCIPCHFPLISNVVLQIS